MKRILLLLSVFVISISSFSQSTPIYTDDFESYNHLDYIAVENPTWWKTWSNAPGTGEDAQILSGLASSGTNSLIIDFVPDYSDVVVKLGDRTSGKYDLGWKMYLQNSYGGYYNIQHFEAVGVEFAFEVWFNSDGTGYMRTGAVNYPFVFPQDNWFRVEHIIDLDNNLIKLVIGSNVVHEWPFSYQINSTAGTNRLGGVDFFAATDDGSPPQAFIDDFFFMEFQDYTFYMENFESYSIGDNISVVNPTWWKTWSNLPGSSEDGVVVPVIAHSGAHSLSIDYLPDYTDVVLKLGERTTSEYKLSWYMYSEPPFGGYYNIQHFESVGQEFAFEVWFNAAGTGYLRTGGADYPFIYPNDTWFPIVHYIDLDNDWIKLFINGVMVHEWPFSNTTTGIGGTIQIGGVDFYAASGDGSDPIYLIDDVIFIPTDPTAIPLSPWALGIAICLILSVTIMWHRRNS
jgi:hypothetical protein